MRYLQFIVLFAILLGYGAVAHTEEVDDLFGNDDEFLSSEGDIFTEDDFSDAAEQKKNEDEGKVLSAFISSRIPASSARNIEKAEKVFCYTVSLPASDYDGYIINDLAITGSCGELSAEGRSLIKDAVLHNTSAYSTSVANCEIAPKIMLRYIHGIDSTDVLLSVPCPSVTFFHGRDISSLNAAPGEAILEQIINTYSSLSEKFLSPALLGQMIPNGQIVTQDQKEIVRRMKNTSSPKKWGVEQPQQTVQSQNDKPTAGSKPAKKGWNKLK